MGVQSVWMQLLDIGHQHVHHVVAECQELFRFDLPSVQLARRRKKFLEKFKHYRESLLS